MRTLLLIPVLLLCSPTLSQAEERIEQLRVLTYNIHHGRGRDGKINLQRIAAVIKKAEPHLVALQEVDVKTRRSHGVDQAAELGRLCGMDVRFGKAINYRGGQYGNAVLASRKILASKNMRLPNRGGEPRAAVGAAIQTYRRNTVTLISTHFDHKSSKSRREAAKKIGEIVAASRTPVIVAGDLNCTPEAQELTAFSLVLTSPTLKSLPTFPAANPSKQIDYILVDRRVKWTLEEIKVLDDGGASDHRPLLAVFKIY